MLVTNKTTKKNDDNNNNSVLALRLHRALQHSVYEQVASDQSCQPVLTRALHKAGSISFCRGDLPLENHRVKPVGQG